MLGVNDDHIIEQLSADSMTQPAGAVQEISPKTIKNTSKSLDIYSALRDPLTGEVRLFLEYYPFHQSQLTEEERNEGMQPALREVFWGCIFSDSKNFSEPVAIRANRVCAPSLTPDASSHPACAASMSMQCILAGSTMCCMSGERSCSVVCSYCADRIRACVSSGTASACWLACAPMLGSHLHWPQLWLALELLLPR